MQHRSRTVRAFLASVVVLACLLAAAIVPRTAGAATAPGITVTPGRLNFSLSKDAPEQTIPLTLTNSYPTPVRLSAEFKGIDENAGLLIPTDDIEKTFADNLRISETTIDLKAGESRAVQVQVRNTTTLSPGGHYATLVLTSQDNNSKQLSLKAAISVSLFAVKVEGAVQKLSLTGVQTNGWLFRLPTKARLAFQNDGNVLSVPRGVVSVLDSRYNEISKGVANQESLPLLPGNSITSEVTISKIKATWKPQKFLIWTAYRADGDAEQTVVRSTMWYIPPVYLLIPLLLLIVVWLRARRGVRYRQVCQLVIRVPAAGRSYLRQRLSSKQSANEPTAMATDYETPPVESVNQPAAKKSEPASKELETTTKPAKNTDKTKKTKSKPASKKSDNAVAPAFKKTEIPVKPLLTIESLQERTTTIKPKIKSAAKSTKKTEKKPSKATPTKTKRKKTK